jgi:hypothetical protein
MRRCQCAHNPTSMECFSSHGLQDCPTFGGSLGGQPEVQLPRYFLPKSRASTDHAPGPIIAKVLPKTTSMSGSHMSPPPEKTSHNSTAATSAPATGVHSPARMNSPRTAPQTSNPFAGVPLRMASPLCNRTAPVTRRCMRRPKPGQPSANVEKSRCTRAP